MPLRRSSPRPWKLAAALALVGLALWWGPPEARADVAKPLAGAGVNTPGAGR